MKRKLIAYTLLISLLAAVSCGGETPDITVTDADTTSVSEETTESIYTDLGEHDFEGRKFTIVYSTDQLGAFWPYDAETENGDLVNDAVYKRNRTVEEKYNVDIDYYSTGGVSSEVGAAFLKSIMSGDNQFDLAIGHMFSGINALVSAHALYDFNKLPYVDYDKPWWSQYLRDTLEVDDVLLLHNSDLVYKFNDCIFFNKKIYEDYNFEYDLYKLVKDGKWTWDKLISMAKQVSVDVNNDGVYDEEDLYGYYITSNSWLDTNWVYANGLTIASIENGRISVDNAKSEKMKSVVDMMYGLIKQGNQTLISKNKADIQDIKPFINGRTLFMENITLVLPSMRDADVDFGILPLPKYNEEQEHYYSMASPQMMMLPATLDDSTFTGVLLESLAMESYRTVNPAVYETSFSEKFLRDNDSYEMYTIAQSSGVYDFNWNFGNGNVFAQFMGKLIREDSTDVASFYQTNADRILKDLEMTYEVIKNWHEE